MSPPTPDLRPREHGAYAMLAFPLASGLAVGGVSFAGLAFALLAVAGFLAHEAALVVMGRRGERVRNSADSAARRRLEALGAVALASGVLFVVTAPGSALAWALPPALLGAAVLALVVAGGTKSLAGELLVAAAFASVHAPVAAAGLRATVGRPALVPFLVWAVSFALATLAVHALKARFRGRKPGGGDPGVWVVAASPLAGVAALALAVSLLSAGHPLAPAAVALVPKALLVLGVAALNVHPRNLKRVGWSLVAADLVTLGVLVAAF
ncbi:MAG: YwiC-like family protein [Longimicrobiales bacterium]